MNKFSTTFIFISLLSGCALGSVTPFTSQSEDGMVMIGITGSDRLGIDPILNITTYDPKTFKKNSSVVTGRGNGEFKISGDRKYDWVSVAPGHYAFASMNVPTGYTGGISQRQFCDTKGFEVVPGVVTYIGDYDFSPSSSNNITAKLSWNINGLRKAILTHNYLNAEMVIGKIVDVRIPPGNSFSTADDKYCHVFTVR